MTTRNVRSARLLATAIAGLAFHGAANASNVWKEVGDAGQTLTTAQDVGGNINTINGEIQSTTDYADLYKLNLPATASFMAEVTSYTNLDSLLYLFGADGSGIVASDDGGNGLLSKITVPNLAAGIYYLAFTDLTSKGALDSNGTLWTPFPSGLNAPPPAAFTTLSDWDTTFTPLPEGSYTIALNVSTVPVPAALPLMATALAALGLAGRRRS